MARNPEVGNVGLYPGRPLKASDRNSYVLQFFCPIQQKRIRRNCGTRDRREARRIQRECRERLLNGEYVASDGAITKDQELARPKSILPAQLDEQCAMTWDEAAERYRQHRERRQRKRSSQDATSRIDIANRIFETRRRNNKLPPGATIRECTTLEAMEYLQDQLLDGAESRFDQRSPNTVNSMMAAVMAFVRYCHEHEWIEKVPPIKKLSVDEVMRGRPLTEDEFQRMLDATPKVVGDGPSQSWQFALKILWESGFRIADLMNFSWDDETKIHPVWSPRQGTHPTILIPSTQKNRKVEEIPMLPGLRKLLESVPKNHRTGFVVNPEPIEYEMKSQKSWFMPKRSDLEYLALDYNNLAIAKACGVTEATVRKWLTNINRSRDGKTCRRGRGIPAKIVREIQSRASRTKHRPRAERLTPERVSVVICQIGKESGVIVRAVDGVTGTRTKYASAHDLRRSLSERLINAGVSAETLMVVMRHRDFATTRKHYGATRAAQSAAGEIDRLLKNREKED